VLHGAGPPAPVPRFWQTAGMAEERPPGDHAEPTLELPKLFGRRKKRSEDTADAASAAGGSTLTQPDAAPQTQPDTAPQTRPQPPADEQPSHRAPRRRATERPRRRPDLSALPDLDPRLAALLTGLVVGVVGCLLTYLGLRGCELLRGTSSCGGPGLFVLVAILALMVVTGAVLLAAWKIGEPVATSLLGVGITTVVGMLVLLDVIFSGWMFLVVPALTTAGFGAAHWVTTRFVDQPERGPEIDVR